MNIKNNLKTLLVAPFAAAFFAACTTDVDTPSGGAESVHKLTIHATAGGEGTRVAFGDNGNNTYTAAWTSADKVTIFGNDVNKISDFTVTPDATNPHKATLEGSVSGVTAATTITGFVQNGNIALANSNNQVEVDYSAQKGTFDDAMSRAVLFGKVKYDPKSDNEVNMSFDYKTSFMKLTLNFPEGVASTTASSIILTGDNLLSVSRVNTVGTSAGNVNSKQGSTITIPSAEIDANGKAVVYVALYPQTLGNLKLQATVGEDVYEFNISGSKTAALNAGNVYAIERTGEKVEVAVPTQLDGKGTKASPWLIKSVGDLMYVANSTPTVSSGYANKYFRLENDIIINGEWTPIGSLKGSDGNVKPFRGIFDGNGRCIYGNIVVSGVANAEGAGLFNRCGLGCVIKNLTNKANITTTTSASGNFTGAIIGRAYNSVQLINCKNYGIVNAGTDYAGGLIGQIYLQESQSGKSYKVVVEACSNEGNVIVNRTTTYNRMGGIVGAVNIAPQSSPTGDPVCEIKGCYSNGMSLKSGGTNNFSAGIVGCAMSSLYSADQIKLTSCWVNNFSQTEVSGTNAGIVSHPTSNVNVTLTATACWSSTNRVTRKAETQTKIIEDNCKNSTDKVDLQDFIATMNTAWGSSEYEFATNGTIKAK